MIEVDENPILASPEEIWAIVSGGRVLLLREGRIAYPLDSAVLVDESNDARYPIEILGVRHSRAKNVMRADLVLLDAGGRDGATQDRLASGDPDRIVTVIRFELSQ